MTTAAEQAYLEAMGRLRDRLGADDATVVVTQALMLARLDGVTTADELFLFGTMLAETPRGGFVEAVGRGLRVTALLLGAKKP